jgi:zinc protease
MKLQHRARVSLLVVLVLFFTSLPIVTAQTARTSTEPRGEGIEKITSVEGITEYRLANGMKVLLFPDQTKQTITVNITYLVGSRRESKSRRQTVNTTRINAKKAD